MTAHTVELKVSASVPKDCSFWLEDNGWNGVCEDLSLIVRGSSFEDAKRKMEAALQVHIEHLLREHSRASRKQVA
jgi:predicted RNase H-like HicB family nuclease